MTYTKKNNGIDTMSKHDRKQKQREFKRLVKVIERRLIDEIARAEAKLLLHVLIHHFDGFARQQNLVNEHMASVFHWGNKRSARVLKKLAEIGVITRSKSESDNWTLFFIVRGFVERCRERVDRALVAIRERMKRCRVAILSISRMRDVRTGTRDRMSRARPDPR